MREKNREINGYRWRDSHRHRPRESERERKRESRHTERQRQRDKADGLTRQITTEEPYQHELKFGSHQKVWPGDERRNSPYLFLGVHRRHTLKHGSTRRVLEPFL